MEIRKCSKCGFILGTRPGLKDDGEVCLACANKDAKLKIDWKKRQKWLTGYLEERRIIDGKYDVAVGVSGGKDSTTIVKRLIREHGVSPGRILCIHMCDEFTPSKAGLYNRENLRKTFNVDLIDFHFQPERFVEETKKDFLEKLHPLRWFEAQLYQKTMELARMFCIPTLFMGENSAFEYGEDTECSIFHPASTDRLNVIYMGAIWPYSTLDSLKEAKDVGFHSLEEHDDWYRQGSGDAYSQIDSMGYMIHLWTKFIKFGFQRVSDMACRFVREGVLTKEQAEQMIRDEDWRCDPQAKEDFCRTIGIDEKTFDETVDRFADPEFLVKDANGNWRRRDLI